MEYNQTCVQKIFSVSELVKWLHEGNILKLVFHKITDKMDWAHEKKKQMHNRSGYTIR